MEFPLAQRRQVVDRVLLLLCPIQGRAKSMGFTIAIQLEFLCPWFPGFAALAREGRRLQRLQVEEVYLLLLDQVRHTIFGRCNLGHLHPEDLVGVPLKCVVQVLERIVLSCHRG